jgi:PDZ domain-containing protein
LSRRTATSIVVAAVLAGLLALVAFVPVPYVALSPGPTIDVLGKQHGSPIVRVDGHRSYRDTGDLRMVTISVTGPDQSLNLYEALVAWVNGAETVLPRAAVYPPNESAQESQQTGTVEMVDSQDTAVAAALTKLGYHLPVRVEVLAVTPGGPSDGTLRPHDRLLRVNGTRITDVHQVSKAIQKTGVGAPAHFVVRRNGKTKHLAVTAKLDKSGPHPRAIVGITVGNGYRFPFDVSVSIPPAIGGPSAGLMFSLAVYDTLTPGSLTGGRDVAGTGTITQQGRVGPIGGIQQKIVAAADDGATLFLVPPGNCAEALHADVRPGQIRLVKAANMSSAISSLHRYAKNRSARLPSCAGS